MTHDELISEWGRRADEMAEHGIDAVARAYRIAIAELQTAQRAAADETLTLAEAARESGYSVGRLRHMVADGTVPNAGRKGAPRIRRADLPRRAQRTNGSGFDPRAAASRLIGD